MVEDNPQLRENTVELLELAGYKVFTADNGQRGYELTRDHLPNVVLCDMVMPQSGGKEFLDLIKADPSCNKIPIIFFSAGSAPIEVRKGLIAGADAYLRKPFTNDELLDTVRNCIELGKKRNK